jgi:hypothetical protein
MGADLPKSALKTEDHVPRAEHTDPLKSCLIRDDLHMRAHLRSKGHLTLALKEIRRTRAERLLQWHTESGHENIFMDEKFFTIRSSITTRTTRFMLKRSLRCILRVQGCHHPCPRHGLVGGVPSGGDIFIFPRKE